MSPGPLRLADMLPAGITPDDFYGVLAGIAAFLTVLTVGAAMRERDTLGPRLRMIAERRAQLKGQAIAPSKRRIRNRVDRMRRIVTVLHLLKKNRTARLDERLLQAGCRSRDAIVIYTFFKLVCAIAGGIVVAALVGIDFNRLTENLIALLSLPIGLYVGAKLPDLYLTNRRGKRWHRIRKALPDALDLMLICAEAGLTLGASLDRVSRELMNAYPEMGDELALTSIELGFLPERRLALDHLARRVNLPEVRGIVNVLLQTEKYGTPIAQALRTLTAEFRTQRLLRAEQKAARLPALMTVPMIVFILPCLFIVVLAPAIIKLLATL